ncbi:hypothetical protein, partial [Planomonospora sp. ID82291]|uniref:hypothetical protein n=1 Tax=Planomonospora sp. ID82291 TaxID=2738136 RepID=UPI0018C3E46A
RAARPLAPIQPTIWRTRLQQTGYWTDPYGDQKPVTHMTPYETYMALAWLEVNAARITPIADPIAWVTATPLAQALIRQAS